VKCKLIEERDEAVWIHYKQYKMWFPKTTIKNTSFPLPDEEFELIVPEWLLEKKIQEYLTPKTGRKVVSEKDDSNIGNEDDISY